MAPATPPEEGAGEEGTSRANHRKRERAPQAAGTKWGSRKYLDISLLKRQDIEVKSAAPFND